MRFAAVYFKVLDGNRMQLPLANGVNTASIPYKEKYGRFISPKDTSLAGLPLLSIPLHVLTNNSYSLRRSLLLLCPREILQLTANA
jgi:hypothetical protein